MNKKPTRWSYSSLSTYESCPAKWKYAYIDDIYTPPNAAMARGSRLHENLEFFMKGESPILSWELNKVKRKVEDYKTMGGQAEAVWTLNNEWTPGDPAWVKAIVDLHYTTDDGKVLHVIDYKSGREYPEHRDQLELYGIIGLCKFPEVDRVEYSALYLDSGFSSNEGSLIRDFLPHKIKSWTDRAIPIFTDTTYAPRPGPMKCKWCDYNRSKGGPCDAGV